MTNITNITDLVADVTNDDDLLEREMNRGCLFIGRGIQSTQSVRNDERHVVHIDDSNEVVSLSSFHAVVKGRKRERGRKEVKRNEQHRKIRELMMYTWK